MTFHINYATGISEVQHMGQYTWDKLINSKQMEVCGNSSVYQSEIKIDCGIAFNREHNNNRQKVLLR
jgi:hypothetical protein